MPPSEVSHANLARGYPIALASAVLLSTTAIFIRYLNLAYRLPPLILACWRDGFVALTLLPILVIFYPSLARIKRQYWPYLIIYGLVLALFNALWTLSVVINGAAISTVLVYCSAGFTALLGRWFLKEQLGWVKILVVVVTLAGCVLVSGAVDPSVWKGDIAGILTGVLSGLGYAIYSLMGRSAAQRGLNPWTTLLYTFGFAAIFLLMINLFSSGIIPGTATRPEDFLWLGKAVMGWVVLFLLAAGPSLAGYGLYNVSLSFLPSSVANLILILEPVFTAIIAYFFLSEHLDGVQIGGSLLILGGVIALRLYEGRSMNSSKI